MLWGWILLCSRPSAWPLITVLSLRTTHCSIVPPYHTEEVLVRVLNRSVLRRSEQRLSLCCPGLWASGLLCVCMCLSVYGDTSVCPIIHSLSRAAGRELRGFVSLRDLDIARLGAPGPIRPGRSSPTRQPKARGEMRDNPRVSSHPMRELMRLTLCAYHTLYWRINMFNDLVCRLWLCHTSKSAS